MARPGMSARGVGLRVLEDLEPAGAARDHHDAAGALVHGVRLLEGLVRLVPREVELDLEAEEIAIEADQAIRVAGRERRVVDADDHGGPP